MSKAPCYQRYPSDFFGDTKVRIMSSDARAYYSLLLDCIWDYDTQYSIPNDDDLISKLLVIDTHKWLSFSQEIISCLQVKSGRLVSSRLKREKEKQDKFRKRQSINGKAGGRPRKSHGLPTALPEESLPLPLPITSLEELKKYTWPLQTEQIKEASELLIDEWLEAISDHLYRTNIFPEAPVFKNSMLSNGHKYNKRAVLHSLNQWIKKKKKSGNEPGNAWSYCFQILKVESGNFNEREAIKSHS
jgi:uncharacterized protein YdaU (DUF1376 family)